VPDAAHALDMRSPGFVEGLKELLDANPGKPLAMICASGARSAYVANALKAQGVPVIDVSEGMNGSDAGPGWLQRSLPVRTPDAAIVTE
jgi:rhodanese-related sulfurtransferase